MWSIMSKSRSYITSPGNLIVERAFDPGFGSIFFSRTDENQVHVLDQLLDSTGHPFPVPKQLEAFKNQIDAGGDFRAVQHHASHSMYWCDGKTVRNIGDVLYSRAIGCLVGYFPSDGPSLYPGATVLDSNDMARWGTKGFALTIPTKPESEAGQFLAELRDLPKLPALDLMKNKARYFRNLAKNGGKEYLNAEFGWKPFISDVKKQTAATVNAKKHIKSFQDNSGQRVKRRIDLGTTRTSSSSTKHAQGLPGNAIYVYDISGDMHIDESFEQRVWFSACYRYYIPPLGKDWLSNIAAGEAILHKLYGLRVDPHLLWELSPWTWMADYFGNVGDIMTNLSAFSSDNLVALYAYVMVESTGARTYSCSGTCSTDGSTVSPSSTFTTVTKQRYKGNPYGFAVGGSLTNNQAGILGALGLSRLPHKS